MSKLVSMSKMVKTVVTRGEPTSQVGQIWQRHHDSKHAHAHSTGMS